MKKLKDLLKESFVWERKFGEKLPTLDSVQKKHNQLKEYKGLDKSVKKQFMQVNVSMKNIQQDVLIDMTNKNKGDKPQLGKNHKEALKSLQVLDKELIKLKKLLKIK
tara:strand:- start:221 stop:541 length:321 start_codon:yes stop_codon:yes gene_type:complete